jgi:predicted amidophosphoribosyltransferase
MYRTFAEPLSDGWTTHDWVRWLMDQKVYLPVKPTQSGVCSTCWGPTPVGQDGTRYWKCYQCYSGSRVAGLVPVSYSYDQGLESMIYCAKNGQRWLNRALVSLLHEALHRHLTCIEARFGRIDLITMLPSHIEARGGWDHMKDLHSRLKSWPQSNWDLDLLIKVKASDADDRRGTIDPALFQVQQTRDLRNRRVLLVDDTWTSGGTINSAAAAILSAGGLPPVVLTLGRQFRPNPPDGDTEFQKSLQYGTLTDLDECAVHRTELSAST